MPIDPTPALNRLVAVLQALPVQHVYSGAPESLDSRVNAYVTLDRWAVADEAAGGLARHEIDYAVTFGYRVSGAESTVETDLAAKVGAFCTALLAERRSRLNGTVERMGLPDLTRAAAPQYAVVAGTEFRIYPCVIPTVQLESY